MEGNVTLTTDFILILAICKMCKQHIVEVSHEEREKTVEPEKEIQSCVEPFAEVVVSEKDTFVYSSPKSTV